MIQNLFPLNCRSALFLLVPLATCPTFQYAQTPANLEQDAELLERVLNIRPIQEKALGSYAAKSSLVLDQSAWKDRPATIPRQVTYDFNTFVEEQNYRQYGQGTKSDGGQSDNLTFDVGYDGRKRVLLIDTQAYMTAKRRNNNFPNLYHLPTVFSVMTPLEKEFGELCDVTIHDDSILIDGDFRVSSFEDHELDGAKGKQLVLSYNHKLGVLTETRIHLSMKHNYLPVFSETFTEEVLVMQVQVQEISKYTTSDADYYYPARVLLREFLPDGNIRSETKLTLEDVQLGTDVPDSKFTLPHDDSFVYYDWDLGKQVSMQ